MRVQKYYKISPEWAERLNLTDKFFSHPDGWYLVLPTYLLPLVEILQKEGNDDVTTLDEAVTKIGGCIYNADEAVASQRGVKEYMMNAQEEKKTEEAVETKEISMVTKSKRK